MAQPSCGRRIGEEVQAKRPRGGPLGRRRLLREVELRAGAPGLHPQAPASARDEPGRRRAVALRDPALGQHLVGAVRAGVAAVGPEDDVPAALVERRTVASPEAGQVLVGTARPGGPEPQLGTRAPVRPEHDGHPLVRGQGDLEFEAMPTVQRAGDRHHVELGQPDLHA